MKLLYLAVFDRKRDIGVCKKIADQLKGFEAYGIKTKLVRITQAVSRISVLGNEYLVISHNWMDVTIHNDVDVLYIRYPKSTPGFLEFIRKFKSGRPDRKVIIEIPTYPYDGELQREDFLINTVDKICRNLLRHYADRIVTYSNDKYIWGIRTIRSVNGICVKDIEPREIMGPANEINMIAVASMKPWHGYERIIKGMSEYYRTGGKRTINLHLVGNGPDISLYKQLAGKPDLNNRVRFYGVKEGKDLQALYNQCDVGLVGFGYFKIGLHILSAIKTREYAAMGLPMVIAGNIDIFPADKYSFTLEVPENDSPVDFNSVIQWYDELYGEHGEKRQEVANKIRTYAYKKCDSKVVMRRLYKYLSDENVNKHRRK